VVAERSVCAEAGRASNRGADRSENVGISSITAGENPARRKPKVSWATQIVPGWVGPKPRPKGVGDGQQVNIPARWRDYPSDDAGSDSAGSLVMCLPQGADWSARTGQCRKRIGREKSLGYVTASPYRKPTQVGGQQICQGVRENPRLGTRQNSGRTFGTWPTRSQEWVAINDVNRLFTKNTGPC